ncbi:MAG: hypothetical protein KatS3mg008_1184 [Acidimicrobiales bacterium]|nr:MAG: hypothetical protein KatS3mg008_1184 [Acidimicrobiales bacterium]
MFGRRPSMFLAIVLSFAAASASLPTPVSALTRSAEWWNLAAARRSTVFPGRAAGGPTAEERAWIDWMNEIRSESGLAPLEPLNDLVTSARDWSRYMAEIGNLQHSPDPLEGVEVDWLRVAENVGFGTETVLIQQGFMNSPSHRANILDPGMTYVGVGVYHDDVGLIWVTQRFVEPAPPTTSTTVPPSPPPPLPSVPESLPLPPTPPRQTMHISTTTSISPPLPTVQVPKPSSPPPRSSGPVVLPKTDELRVGALIRALEMLHL